APPRSGPRRSTAPPPSKRPDAAGSGRAAPGRGAGWPRVAVAPRGRSRVRHGGWPGGGRGGAGGVRGVGGQGQGGRGGGRGSRLRVPAGGPPPGRRGAPARGRGSGRPPEAG